MPAKQDNYREIALTEVPDCCAVCGFMRFDEQEGGCLCLIDVEDGNEDTPDIVDLFDVCDRIIRVRSRLVIGEAICTRLN